MNDSQPIDPRTVVDGCVYDKVYSKTLLLSDPPQKMWICRSCLEEGQERCGDRYGIPLDIYDDLKRKKEGRQAENPKHTGQAPVTTTPITTTAKETD